MHPPQSSPRVGVHARRPPAVRVWAPLSAALSMREVPRAKPEVKVISEKCVKWKGVEGGVVVVEGLCLVLT